jgi:oxygen-independent coproporphyrinogen-3 oxidase
MNVYNDALNKEIRLFAESVTLQSPLQTLYIGGGTPSTWPPSLLLDTFATLNNMFVFENNAEITLEVNPGTVTPEKVAAWKLSGINRLSVGVQSLNDAVLKQMGRYHTAADVERFFELTAGIFENISIDLIIGLPGIEKDEWRRQLETVVRWPIKHVSLYFLTVHEHTRLHADLQRGLYELPSEEEVLNAYEETIALLGEWGIKQYEVSNCAREGFESRHNKAYWNRVAYKSFGLGSSSFDGLRRFTATSNLTNYLEKVQQGHDVTEQSEMLTAEQIHLEHIMLGLRQIHGVAREDFLKGKSDEECALINEQIALFIDQGLLVERAGRIVATLRGFMLENHLVSKLTI